MENEEWKDIPGYEGFYQASSLGRIKGLKRIVNHGKNGTMVLAEKILKPFINDSGYSVVSLSNFGRLTRTSHRLVALAFIPNPENKPEINHKNGIKNDNRPDNLEWATSLENKAHALDLGLIKIGSDRVQSKLTEVQVLEIRSIKNTKQQDVANMFNVTKETISAIVTRRNWKHI